MKLMAKGGYEIINLSMREPNRKIEVIQLKVFGGKTPDTKPKRRIDKSPDIRRVGQVRTFDDLEGARDRQRYLTNWLDE